MINRLEAIFLAIAIIGFVFAILGPHDLVYKLTGIALCTIFIAVVVVGRINRRRLSSRHSRDHSSS